MVFSSLWKFMYLLPPFFFLSHLIQSVQCSMIFRRPKQCWTTREERWCIAVFFNLITADILSQITFLLAGVGVILCTAGCLAVSLASRPTRCRAPPECKWNKSPDMAKYPMVGKSIPSWQPVIYGTILRLCVNE